MPQVIWQGQRGSRWNRNMLSPSTPSKNHPEKKRDTPQNNERRCSWSCQHPDAKEPASRKLQGAPAAASEESICAGGVSKNGTMLSPKLLLCPPLCHKRHLTPHHREGVCSALLWRARMKPRRQSSEAPSPPGLSDGQATYLGPAEPAVPTESSRLSGLSAQTFKASLRG